MSVNIDRVRDDACAYIEALGPETNGGAFARRVLALCDDVEDLRNGVAAGRRAAESAKTLADTLMEVGRVLGAEPYSSPVEAARATIAEVERGRKLAWAVEGAIAQGRADAWALRAADKVGAAFSVERCIDEFRAALARYEEG